MHNRIHGQVYRQSSLLDPLQRLHKRYLQHMAIVAIFFKAGAVHHLFDLKCQLSVHTIAETFLSSPLIRPRTASLSPRLKIRPKDTVVIFRGEESNERSWAISWIDPLDVYPALHTFCS